MVSFNLKKTTRDTVLFLFGLSIGFHEVFIYNGPTERVYVLTFAATLLGLPFLINSDQKKADDEDA